MKNIILLLTFALLTACKKESTDFSAPITADYAGQYFAQGDIRVLSGDSSEVTPLYWANVVDQQGKYFNVFGSAFENTSHPTSLPGYRIGLNGEKQIGEFWLEITTREGSSALSDKIIELLQPQAQIPIGTGAGQINIRFVNLLFFRWYDTMYEDNSTRFVTVEKVEDLNVTLDGYTTTPPKWAKKVSFSFTCQMGVDPQFNNPDVRMENCRVVLPFILN